MLTSLFPLLYIGAFLFLLVQGFQMMRLGRSANTANNRCKDRTGLRTTHPELLNADGELTNEDLLVVHFPDLDQAEPSR
ncbi:putative conserved membrane protein [Synechococcus sp. RS9909]|uniref:DUF2973 domain-containing protein n=1 Tax=unclassified Synechococcus TaxID=2626047 RepID=UPI000068F63A|nr:MULTISPECIES: DUF2973 domain-containing protein [unclassified Synechococcus]EAQ69686.1 hypothetical protein RS9917_09631 [Synechococcus sp. RS9917]QNI80040.1 putative conserved membrane protein [Synechococcus sp. RS9909]